jgi:hypothetical protein
MTGAFLPEVHRVGEGLLPGSNIFGGDLSHDSRRAFRRVTTCDTERTFRAGPASPRNSSPKAPAAGRAPLRASEPIQKVSDLQRSPLEQRSCRLLDP